MWSPEPFSSGVFGSRWEAESTLLGTSPEDGLERMKEAEDGKCEAKKKNSSGHGTIGTICELTAAAITCTKLVQDWPSVFHHH